MIKIENYRAIHTTRHEFYSTTRTEFDVATYNRRRRTIGLNTHWI
jgi:hypothetical protein